MNPSIKHSLLLLCIAFLTVTGVCGRSRFEEYHAASLSSTPIKLDDASYENLTSTLRNYTTVVLLTAQDVRFGCQLCRDFEPEWDLVAKSWIKGDKHGGTRVLYGTLDFADGKETFQKVIRASITHIDLKFLWSSGASWCYKPPLSCFCFLQIQGQMENPMVNLCGMISPWGKFENNTLRRLLFWWHSNIADFKPPNRFMIGSLASYHQGDIRH